MLQVGFGKAYKTLFDILEVSKEIYKTQNPMNWGFTKNQVLGLEGSSQSYR